MIFNTERGPFPPAFGLVEEGKLLPVRSKESTATRLSVGFETLDRELFDPEPCYDLLAETGVKWARCQSGWSRCEKTPGVYDFAWLDRVIDRFCEVGIQPWLGLSFGNRLYSPDAKHPSAVGCPPVCYGEKAVAAWKNFIRAVVERYRGRVTHFEIWNEPDNPPFWGPGKPSMEQYLELVHITSGVIRKAYPEAKIIAGAFSHPLSAVQCLKLGMGNDCDIVSYHSYSMHPEFCSRNYADCIREAIRTYAPHLDLWHGESGCPSESKDHYDEWLRLYRSSPEIQAKWLARRIATDFRNGLSLFSYYHACDLTLHPYVNGDGVPTKVGRMGLIHAPGAVPKLSYHVLQHFCAFFDSGLENRALKTIIGCDDVHDPRLNPQEPRDFFTNVLLDTYTRNGYPLYLYYYPGDLQRSETMSAANGNTFQTNAEKEISTPVLLDTLTGAVYRFTQFSIDNGTLHLKSVPLTDYPLVITDRDALPH